MNGEIPLRLTVVATGEEVPVELVAVERAELERLRDIERAVPVVAEPEGIPSGLVDAFEVVADQLGWRVPAGLVGDILVGWAPPRGPEQVRAAVAAVVFDPRPRTWAAGFAEDDTDPPAYEAVLVDPIGALWRFDAGSAGWWNTTEGPESPYDWPAALAEAVALREVKR